MKSSGCIQRKSTITSTAQSETNPKQSTKSQKNRITSFKNISFEQLSFSHHICQEGKRQASKMGDFLNSQGSQSPYRTLSSVNDENAMTKNSKQSAKNPFVLACLNSKNKPKIKKNDILMERYGLDQQQEDIDEITTFRMIKKGKLQAEKGHRMIHYELYFKNHHFMMVQHSSIIYLKTMTFLNNS